MKHILIFLLKIYQKTISPDHGLLKARYPYGYCRFYPTCSEYSIESIRQFGSAKGLWMTTIRLLRCNPFTPPGVDKPNKL